MNIKFERNRATIESCVVVEQILLREDSPVVSNIEVYVSGKGVDSQHLAVRQNATPLTDLQFRDYVRDLVENRTAFVLDLMH